MPNDQDKFNEVFSRHDEYAAKATPVKTPAPESKRPERDYQPARRGRQGKSGCLGGLMYFVFVISVSVIIACLVWMAATDVLALNKGDLSAVVELPDEIFEVTRDDEGNTLKTADISYVAQALKDAGIIEYKWLFNLYCSVSDAEHKLDAGSYELRTTYDYRALVKKMQTGSSAMLTVEVVIPEGFSMHRIFQTLEDNDVCDYDDLMDAAANYEFNYSFLGELEKGDATRLEGYLFPDTYEFYTGMEPSSAIAKFLDNFRNRLTAEMLDWAAENEYGLAGAVNIASMIEKEAAHNDERSLIASVIYNRLEAGMPLQIDATSLYMNPDHEGAPTAEMLADTTDPYNTRINMGLPPTAICSPGTASMRAALSPADTSYLYYALDVEAGTHRFFTNYNDFAAFSATQNYE